MSDPFQLKLPVITQSKQLFANEFLSIQCDTLKQNKQAPYPYYSLLTQPAAVVILALTPDGHYVLIREYRHPTRQVLLSCPAGYLEEGEDPIKAARRELREETGFDAQNWTLMGSAYPYAGISGQKNFYVRADNAHQVAAPQLERSEIIQVKLTTPLQLQAKIKEGIALDGTLGTALFFYTTFP